MKVVSVQSPCELRPYIKEPCWGHWSDTTLHRLECPSTSLRIRGGQRNNGRQISPRSLINTNSASREDIVGGPSWSGPDLDGTKSWSWANGVPYSVCWIFDPLSLIGPADFNPSRGNLRATFHGSWWTRLPTRWRRSSPSYMQNLTVILIDLASDTCLVREDDIFHLDEQDTAKSPRKAQGRSATSEAYRIVLQSYQSVPAEGASWRIHALVPLAKPYVSLDWPASADWTGKRDCRARRVSRHRQAPTLRPGHVCSSWSHRLQSPGVRNKSLPR